MAVTTPVYGTCDECHQSKRLSMFFVVLSARELGPAVPAQTVMCSACGFAFEAFLCHNNAAFECHDLIGKLVIIHGRNGQGHEHSFPIPDTGWQGGGKGLGYNELGRRPHRSRPRAR